MNPALLVFLILFLNILFMGMATYEIVYQGVDVSKDLGGMVTSISYHDRTEGEADELTICVTDVDRRWLNAWQPQMGDKVSAKIMVDGGVLDCGTFRVDEVSEAGSGTDGDMMEIRCLGAGVVDGVRTKTSFAHEGKSLLSIARAIAQKYGYRLQGLIHNYPIKRVTQFHESDMGFLHRLSAEYGYIFALRGNILVFTYAPALAGKNVTGLTISKGICISHRLRDKVAGIYVRGQNRFHNSKDKVIYNVLLAAGANPSKDVANVRDHVDNAAEGLYKVDGRIYKKNLDQVEIELTMPGNVGVMAGVNVVTDGWGNYDGVFFVGTSGHTVTSDGGYVTDCVLKKILQNAPTGNQDPVDVDEVD